MVLDAPTSAGPLAGFTVGITADRRRDELAAMLMRRGARVVSAPAIQIVPVAHDDELYAVTRQVIAQTPDIVVVTTGIGFRGWLEAAEGWGLADTLHTALERARLVARGPKAAGAIRAAGLREAWSPDSESSAEVQQLLLAEDLAGAKITVQLHGEPQTAFCRALTAAGADVVEVPVYRWVLPDDVNPLRRLTEQVIAGGIDALAFTSAPAVSSMLRFAESQGDGPALIAKLRSDVLLACVGPVCASPFKEFGLHCVLPERSRLGGLVRVLAEALPEQRSRVLAVAGHALEVRGHGVLLDGGFIALAAGPMAVLTRLAAQPGRVVTRDELLDVLPGDSRDAHAVESTMARLRTQLGDAALIRTVVKRGYRLACESDSRSSA
jgi:uroporphyrinogen-III synthase